MANFLDAHLSAVGVETRLVELGKHVMDNQELDLPPVILGRIGNDPKKKTVLVYGHFDVQPVSMRFLSYLEIAYASLADSRICSSIVHACLCIAYRILI